MLIGSGYLALPNAFTQGGLISSSLVLIVVLLVMIMTCLWEGRCVVKCGRILKLSKVPEVAEAINLYCGSRWRDSYIMILAISHFIACSAYAILFARTLSYTVPQIYQPNVSCVGNLNAEICSIRYTMNVVILGIITTPLALMDVKEQAWLQNALAILRIFRITLMCVTALYSVGDKAMKISFPTVFDDDDTPYIHPPLIFGTWNGFFVTISVGVFALLLNSTIPVIVDAMRSKKNFVRVLVRGFVISFSLYFTVALIISIKFANKSFNPCNLNWHDYRIPYIENCQKGDVCDITANIIVFFVVFCPVFDVISIFPISTIIFANSICEYFGILHQHHSTTFDSNHQSHNDKNSLQLASFNESKPLISTNPIRSVIDNPTTSTYNSVSSHSLEHNSDSPPSQVDTDHRDHADHRPSIVRFAINILPLVFAVLVPNFMNVIQCAGAVSVLVGLAYPAYMSLRCDDFERRNKFYSALVNPTNHLHWIDSPFPAPHALTESNATFANASDAESSPYFDALEGVEEAPLQDTIPKTTVPSNRKVYTNPDEDWIERRQVKQCTLFIGMIITGIIFYVSF